jgi:cytochrome oxidase Cu insertion factor (SCO1/SenC/PrrC family)
MRTTSLHFASVALFLAASSCARTQTSPDPTPTATTPATGAAREGTPRPAAALVQTSVPAVSGHADLGQPAPDFELPDLDGNKIRLSSLRGKTVVLEWFNPGCPFVKASHTKGSLKGLADREMAKGVTWMAINSAAPGKQGYGVEANIQGKKQFGLAHPILLDESGSVGHAYGAKHTPHIFIVDAKGTLVYRGGIDNSPDGEGDSPQGGTLVNYAESALSDIAAGRAVRVSESEAYGCGVKYGNP